MDRMRKQTKQWTMRDGNKIRICDMGLDHLKNTIGMLERGADSRYRADIELMLSCEPHGDMAELDYDNGLDAMMEEGIESYLPETYWNLVNDLERRELEARNEN
jgi:hypothetical protein